MSNKRQVIGVYGFSMQEILHRPFLGVLRYCEEVGGFSTRDFRTLDVIDHDGKILAPPWRGRCDGIILSIGHGPGMTDVQVANWVLSGGVPAVSVAGDWRDPRIISVHTDQTSVGRLAANHLGQCGCRSFLYVGYSQSIGSAHRARAFHEALAERRLKAVEYSFSTVLLGTMEDEAKLQREKELVATLRSLPRPLGIWALNDIYAAAVGALCQKLGLTIPEQVKLIGTDDLALARTNVPTLSSIRTPGEQIGYLAMKSLHKLIEGKATSSRQVPAKEVVVRESTLGEGYGASTLDAAVEYIERHACTGVTVEQLAQMLGISSRSLSEKFRERFGRSPIDEIQRVRLERAKLLLRHEQVSISRVAAMVGFAETAAFSKFFSKHMGMSPRAFRQEQN